MMENKECIFCKIANKEIKSFTIYEDLNFISFLSIYPNTPGVAVVIPRKHYGSDIFSLENNVINDLMSSVKNVAKILENWPTNTEHALSSKQHMDGIMKQIKNSPRDVNRINDLKVYLTELDRRRGTSWPTLFPWLDKDWT